MQKVKIVYQTKSTLPALPFRLNTTETAAFLMFTEIGGQGCLFFAYKSDAEEGFKNLSQLSYNTDPDAGFYFGGSATFNQLHFTVYNGYTVAKTYTQEEIDLENVLKHLNKFMNRGL